MMKTFNLSELKKKKVNRKHRYMLLLAIEICKDVAAPVDLHFAMLAVEQHLAWFLLVRNCSISPAMSEKLFRYKWSETYRDTVASSPQ